MTFHRSNSSLAVAAGGLLGFVVLISGVWHPKMPAGGLTQQGRHASVTFADGSVMELTQPETDLDILRRRRMGGWQGHEFTQIFITADGRELDVPNIPAALNEGSGEFNTGNRLMLAAYNLRDAKTGAAIDTTDGAVVASLQVDGKDRVVNEAVDGKDRVITDVIDGKDRVITDAKDAKDAPVFALENHRFSLDTVGPDSLLTGIFGGDFGTLRGPGFTGSLGGGGGSGGGGGGGVPNPPIGGAVPEPSVAWMVGAAGLLALGYKACQRRKASVSVV